MVLIVFALVLLEVRAAYIQLGNDESQPIVTFDLQGTAIDTEDWTVEFPASTDLVEVYQHYAPKQGGRLWNAKLESKDVGVPDLSNLGDIEADNIDGSVSVLVPEKFQLECVSSKGEFPDWVEYTGHSEDAVYTALNGAQPDTGAAFPEKQRRLINILLHTSYDLFVAKCAELTSRHIGEVKLDADKDKIICAPLPVGEQGFDFDTFSDVIEEAKGAFKYNKKRANAICSRLLSAARGYSHKVDELVARRVPNGHWNGQSQGPTI